ncbi:MAG TPA: hypothetical protein GXZ36_04490 [Firmicutes bacterium]|nr:hypothetical protein [Bacillota bacterium]
MTRRGRQGFFLVIIICLLLVFIPNAEVTWSALEITDTGAESRFGKVKAPPRPLRWKVLKTPHFEIYFYQGMEELVMRCRDILENEAYERIYPDFESFYALHPYKKIKVIIFTSRKEYQNSRANGLPLSTTSEGVANILNNRIVAIRQPTLQDLRCVLTHEVTHLITLGNRSALSSSLGGQVPGWMAEGLAEFYEPEDTRFFMREVALRDAVLREGLHTLSRLEQIGGNLDYAEAWSLVDYIARVHGKDKLPELLMEMFKRGDRDTTYERTLSLNKQELWENWKTDLEKHYVEGKDNPSIKQEHLPLIEGYGHQQDPKIDRNGRVFFLSTHQSKFFDLYMWTMDGCRRLTEQTVIAYDIAPDGQEAIFISDSDGERNLYKLEIETGKITPFPMDLSNPVDLAWSPRGDKLAVTVNTRGDTDIFIIDLQGRVLMKVAAGSMDERAAAWAPDGERLVYMLTRLGRNQLMIWEGETSRPLTIPDRDYLEPFWGTDDFIWCITGENGYYQVVTIDPENGEVQQVSGFQETLLHAVPAPDGRILSDVYAEQETKIYSWTPQEVKSDE